MTSARARRPIRARLVSSLATALLLVACGEEGLTSAEVQEAAKERVAAKLGLAPTAALFTDVFVGKSVEGDLAVCGTVEGRRTDGTKIPPRLFIAAADPKRWVAFRPTELIELESHPDLVDGGAYWEAYCRGAREIDGLEGDWSDF